MLDGLWAVLLAVLERSGELGLCGESVECRDDWSDVSGGGGVSVCLCVGVDGEEEWRGEEQGSGKGFGRFVKCSSEGTSEKTKGEN